MPDHGSVSSSDQGFRTPHGQPFSGPTIHLLRKRWGLPTWNPRSNLPGWSDGMYSVAAAAELLQVPGTISHWLREELAYLHGLVLPGGGTVGPSASTLNAPRRLNTGQGSSAQPTPHTEQNRTCTFTCIRLSSVQLTGDDLRLSEGAPRRVALPSARRSRRSRSLSRRPTSDSAAA